MVDDLKAVRKGWSMDGLIMRWLIQVVYVARNPKDVIVSFYHHHRLIPLHDYHGDFEEFANYFLNDESKTTKSFPLKHHIAITASSL